MNLPLISITVFPLTLWRHYLKVFYGTWYRLENQEIGVPHVFSTTGHLCLLVQ